MAGLSDKTRLMTDDALLDSERFAERHEASGRSGPLAVEREALGSDYRATGYTTRAQADELGRLLDLRPGRLLVDVGAGCGWPGLYLADTFGCSVVSTDPVPEGAVAARDRIVADGLQDRAISAIATGDDLAVRNGSVDAIVHSDVLC